MKLASGTLARCKPAAAKRRRRRPPPVPPLSLLSRRAWQKPWGFHGFSRTQKVNRAKQLSHEAAVSEALRQAAAAEPAAVGGGSSSGSGSGSSSSSSSSIGAAAAAGTVAV